MLRYALCSFVFLLIDQLVVAEPLQFNRDIRPILSDNCFACHGFDAKHRKADLRLDVQEAAFAKNKYGEAAIVPGKPDESLIWERIMTLDVDELMPPADSHKKLDDEEKGMLRRWIEEGASYQKHWAFEALEKPEGSGIDDFILRGLQRGGLAKALEADRPTLIRRVSMALTGLPASLEEVDAFLADQEEGAYGRMVERYLASPGYGEEMARHWLDVARYGDTHGMHLDNERQTWAYRDWVVNAFNQNLPYDQFTIDQLAGDLLPNPTQDQMVATGFNRCNVTTGEGGSIAEELIFRYAVDRASTTAQAWLGLTAGCAVCHDHKYDPITAKDFYSLYAFFNSNADPAMDGNALLTEPVVKVKPPDYDARMWGYNEAVAAVKAKLDQRYEAVVYEDPAERDPRPEASITEKLWFEDGFPAGADASSTTGKVELVDEPVASGVKALKVSGVEMGQAYYEKGAEALVVPSEASFELNVYLDPADPPEELMIQFNAGGWNHRAFWGSDVIPWGVEGTGERFKAGELPEIGKWVKLEFEASQVGLAVGTRVNGLAFTLHGGTAYFDRLAVTGTSDPSNDPELSFQAWRRLAQGKDTPGVSVEMNAWLKAGVEAERTPEQLQQLRQHYLHRVCAVTKGEFAEVDAELAAAEKRRDEYDQSVPSSFVFKDLPTPRKSFVMIRGQYDTPGEEVVPATPEVLPPLVQAGERANRLDLAKWLVAAENPLTARVAVNRFWQQLFGIGLVESSHDFGTQGSLPTHPELLDWLALRFQETGWDVKGLMRLMVMSEAFRQESAAPQLSWVSDPKNQQLARGPRFRLDAEQLRDQALAVSGLLNRELGGKGVNPYQPPNIWEPLAFGGSNTRYYKQDIGEKLYRRTIYTFYKRTAPHPLMVNFDAPSREQSCIRRDRTNTPLQALQLMNDVQHFEAARAFAVKMIAAAPGVEDRIKFAYRSVLARYPEPEEMAVVREFVGTQVAKYAAAPEEAKKAISFGESRPPEGIDVIELAAWTLVGNLILNLDEAVMRN